LRPDGYPASRKRTESSPMSHARVPGKVLLVNYAGYFLTANTFIADNSLASLAAALLGHGVPVEILDFQGPREVGAVMDATSRVAAEGVLDHLERGEAPPVELVRQYQADRTQGEDTLLEQRIAALLAKIAEEHVSIVGFKLWAGEGIRRAKAMAEAVKQAFPDVLLVAGGPAVQYAREYFWEYTCVFDRLVWGDGEEALVALALGREPRSGVELDELPFPTYRPDVYPGIETFHQLRILDESRGCFNRCAFCAHTEFSGHRVRRRRAAPVVDEMQRLVREEGVRHIRLSGSNPPWNFVLSLAEEITRRELQVGYAMFSSMNNARPGCFERLRASGLESVFFGIETADPGLLRRAHEKHNRDQAHILGVCQEAMAHGVFVTLSFIVPSPFETAATKQASLDLIARIFEHQNHGSVIVLPPFFAPGSKWWLRPEQYGFSFAPGADRRDYVVQGLELTNDFLLPRNTWADYGFRLHGKGLPELLDECEEFTRAVEALGISTNLDDTSYMLALQGGTAPELHKVQSLKSLIVGGAERLCAEVRRHCAHGETARESI
jgi:pyruvate-formate lyase-activating enzyme